MSGEVGSKRYQCGRSHVIMGILLAATQMYGLLCWSVILETAPGHQQMWNVKVTFLLFKTFLV